MITGNILAGTFTDGNPKTPIGTTYPGILRGLIGKEGAVGAFVGGTSTDEGNTITGTSLYSGAQSPVNDFIIWLFNKADWRTRCAVGVFIANDDADTAYVGGFDWDKRTGRHFEEMTKTRKG